MKIFLSFPMRNRTQAQQNSLKGVMSFIAKKNGFEPVDNLIEKPEGAEKLYCLGEAIKKLGECDAIMLGGEWKYASGCIVELFVAICHDKPVFLYNGELHQCGNAEAVELLKEAIDFNTNAYSVLTTFSAPIVRKK